VETLDAAGWVQTADTGQIDLVTVTKPTGLSDAQGYVIYRMDDALQATAPVFIRIDFGSGPGAINNMGMWLTVGGGSDGAGVITPVWLSAPTSSAPNVAAGNNSTSKSPAHSFGAGEPHWFAIALTVNASAVGDALFMSIERSKARNGSPDDEAVIVMTCTSGSPVNRINWLYTDTTAQPAQETSVSYTLPSTNPSATSDQVGVSAVIPFAGLAQVPGHNIIMAKSSDFDLLGARLTIRDEIGTDRVYQPLGVFRVTGLGGATSDTMLMRYE
jgi:hypothetical protein